jgi:dihydroorotase/N-acyl-D-amino-acid deacylase
LFPTWAQEGSREAVLDRLRDAATRRRIRAEVADIIRDERGGGDASGVQLASCEWDPSLDGKTLAEVTRDRGADPTLENAADTAIWIVEEGGCGGIFHAIDERDLVRVLAHPATMVASDGGVQVFGRAAPHPRSYGTFVRVLGRYVREQGVITLEDAVRKMSALPAQRTGLLDRGLLRPGMKADIAIVDPETVSDRATFERPHQYAVGVATVIVNGRVAFEDGAMTAERPGRVLYGPATVGR